MGLAYIPGPTIALGLILSVCWWFFWMPMVTPLSTGSEICEPPRTLHHMVKCPWDFQRNGLEISCSNGQVIEIGYINYGVDVANSQHQPNCGSVRFGNKTCHAGMVTNHCNNLATCVIRVESMRDSCQENKYLTVQFRCITESVSFQAKVTTSPPTSCPIDTKYHSWTTWDDPSRDSDNCSPQLSHNTPTKRITLRRYSSAGPYVKVIATVSDGAYCTSLALTAMVEIETEGDSVTLHECQMELEVDNGTRILDCVYTCRCECLCPRVHLQFASLQAIGIDNLGWSLCNIQLCVPSI